jgi:hypothetical protein
VLTGPIGLGGAQRAQAFYLMYNYEDGHLLVARYEARYTNIIYETFFDLALLSGCVIWLAALLVMLAREEYLCRLRK